MIWLLACSGSEPEAPPAPARTSVVLVSVDTLRADRVGAYGYTERPTTPALDALAARGAVFEAHTSASPWTTPAHMTMLTGLEPRTHGVTHSFDSLAADLAAGHGFWGIDPERTMLAEVFQAHGYSTAAFTAGATVDARIGFGQGFDHLDETMYKLGDHNVAAMLDWVREQEGPYFLFWHHFEVHAPYLDARFAELPEGLAEGLAAVEEQARQRNPPVEVRHEIHRKNQALLRERGVYDALTMEALYTGGVARSDEALAQLLEVVGEEVLVVVTSDHGEEFGEHDPSAFYDAHGHSLYGEVIDVPWVMAGPGVPALRVAQPSGTSDLVPTLLELVDLPCPEVDGRSFVPALQGRPLPDEPVHAEALAWDYEQKAVRRGDDKLIVSVRAADVAAHGRATFPARPALVEFYDLGADPGEQRNLATREGAPPEVQALYDLARAHHGSTPGEPVRVTLDGDTFENLTSLGYIQE